MAWNSVSLRLEQWLCRNGTFHVSLMNSLLKTICPLKLPYHLESAVCQENASKFCLCGEWLKALSPGRNAWCSASPRPEQMSWVFPIVTKMVISEPSCHWNYHIDSKLCLLGEWLDTLVSFRPNQWLKKLDFPSVTDGTAF